jgi:integrase
MKTEYLLEKEIDMVLSLLTEKNQLVMRAAIHTGLRIGDILALKTEQLKPHFWITEQKTGKKRQVGLPEPLLSDLKKQAGKVWVFEGRSGRKAHSRQAVWKDVKRAAKAFRIPQNVGPHSARKVYAVELLREYGELERVKRALNHSCEAVTLIYAMADISLKSKKRRRSKPGRKKV